MESCDIRLCVTTLLHLAWCPQKASGYLFGVSLILSLEDLREPAQPECSTWNRTALLLGDSGGGEVRTERLRNSYSKRRYSETWGHHFRWEAKWISAECALYDKDFTYIVPLIHSGPHWGRHSYYPYFADERNWSRVLKSLGQADAAQKYYRWGSVSPWNPVMMLL